MSPLLAPSSHSSSGPLLAVAAGSGGAHGVAGWPGPLLAPSSQTSPGSIMPSPQTGSAPVESPVVAWVGSPVVSVVGSVVVGLVAVGSVVVGKLVSPSVVGLVVAFEVSVPGAEVGPAGVVMVVTPLKPVVGVSPSAQAVTQHSAATSRNEPFRDTDRRFEPRCIRTEWIDGGPAVDTCIADLPRPTADARGPERCFVARGCRALRARAERVLPGWRPRERRGSRRCGRVQAAVRLRASGGLRPVCWQTRWLTRDHAMVRGG